MGVEMACVEDIDELVELRLAYLREDSGELDAAVVAGVQKGLPSYYHAHLGKDLFVHVVREGDVIASCAFLLLVEKPLSPAFPNGKTGTVLNVYTRPSARRRGYARRVMQALLGHAQEMGLCVIDLKATDAGYPLYKTLGFADDHSKYHPMQWINCG